MKTIIIAEGITLTASRSTIDRFFAERRKEAERKARAAEASKLAAWLRNPDNWDDPCYSDIYKDVHGVRPRW